MPAAVDRAEALVFNVGEANLADTVVPVDILLGEGLDTIEALYQRGDTVTGIPTGVYDLDALLSGLQGGDQVVAFDLSIPCQVFGLACLVDGSPAYEVQVCAPSRVTVTDGVTTQFTLQPQWHLDDMSAADTIVVPGLTSIDLLPSPRVVQLLRSAVDRGTRVASVRTGAFILAAAGILDGRRATAHWEGTDELARRYPWVQVNPDVLFVDNDGLVLTSAGHDS